jgi:hypothetical protein
MAMMDDIDERIAKARAAIAAWRQQLRAEREAKDERDIHAAFWVAVEARDKPAATVTDIRRRA